MKKRKLTSVHDTVQCWGYIYTIVKENIKSNQIFITVIDWYYKENIRNSFDVLNLIDRELEEL